MFCISTLFRQHEPDDSLVCNIFVLNIHKLVSVDTMPSTCIFGLLEAEGCRPEYSRVVRQRGWLLGEGLHAHGHDCAAGVRCGQQWTQDSSTSRAQDGRVGRQREHPQANAQDDLFYLSKIYSYRRWMTTVAIMRGFPEHVKPMVCENSKAASCASLKTCLHRLSAHPCPPHAFAAR